MTEPTAIATLLELASDAQRPAAEAILGRAHERRLRVLVAGEAKRGKSTLINRLLERDVLPTGVLPVTAISTTVRHGSRDEMLVHYLDGREEAHALDQLARFVTERANPGNVQRVAGVDVLLATSRLAGRQVELVDTPGTGSIFTHNTDTARDAYATLDAVIMVVTATPPISATEKDLLCTVNRHAVRTFVVLNKADQLGDGELTETIDFTVDVCADIGVAGPVFPMSARNADAGFTAFQTQFERYLDEHAAQDTERAIRGHARRFAESMRDEAAIELRSIELGRGQTRAQLAEFRDRLATIATEAGYLDDRCRATERRLRRELDEGARRLRISLTSTAREAVSAEFDASPRDLPAANVESRGRGLLERVVTAAVIEWRKTRAEALERDLADLVATIERERADQLSSLRAHAREQLGLELAAGIDPLPLHAGRLFWLDFTLAPAMELPGAETLRRHGPGAVRRAQKRVLDDLAALTDRQVGRARADLQQRLGETVRQLVAALRVHHIDTLNRLRDILQQTSELTAQSAPQLEEELSRLRDRRRRLDALISELADPMDGQTAPPDHR